VYHQGGGTKEQASIQPPEKEKGYPEPDMFGTMPSHGFYVRHANGIRFDDVEIVAAKGDRTWTDLRPAFVLDDVRDADFFRIRTSHEADTPVFALHNVEDLAIHMCRLVPDTQLPKAEQSVL